MSDKIVASVLVIISALGFGAMGTLATLSYKEDINISTLLTFRFFLAALVFWMLGFFFKINFKQSKRNLLMLFLLGAFGYAVMALLLFKSYQYIHPSLSVLLFYTYPVLVLVISIALKIENFDILKLVSLLTSIIGILLAINLNGKINILGVIYAFVAAIIYALFITISNIKLKSITNYVSSTYITSSAAIVLLVISISNGNLNASFGLKGWGFILAISIFSTIIPILFFFEGIKRLSPSKASILSMVEPIFGVILSLSFFREPVSHFQWIGITLVLISGILTSLNISPLKPLRSKEKLQNSKPDTEKKLEAV